MNIKKRATAFKILMIKNGLNQKRLAYIADCQPSAISSALKNGHSLARFLNAMNLTHADLEREMTCL